MRRWHEVLELINERSVDRFEVQTTHSLIDELLSSAVSVVSPMALRLRRSTTDYAGYHTLLVAEVRSKFSLECALRWAASVRDFLEEPETADLYLIIVEFSLGDTHARLIEADEVFCRKVVKRSDETLPELINRAFTFPFHETVSSRVIGDPLRIALEATGTSFHWLTPDVRSRWQSFLSSESEPDLTESLLRAAGIEPK